MSKELNKVIRNNLNEKNFLKNINRVNFIDYDTSKNDLVPVDIELKKEELITLAIDTRHENLKVYLKSKFIMHLRKLFYFWLPFIFSGLTIGIFTMPRKINKSLDTHYIYEDISIVKNKGIKINQKEDYYSSNKIMSYDYVNNYKQMPDKYNNFLDYEINDGINYVKINFNIDNNGDLHFNQSNSGQKIKAFNIDYDSIIIDDEYLELFNKIVIFLNQDGYLSEEELKLFQNLNNSTKAEMSINIKRYINIGVEEVEYYNDHKILKIILSIVTILYFITYIICLSSKLYQKGIELHSNSIGELYDYDKYGKIGLIHMNLKYDEAFIKAEKTRICKIIKIAKQITPEYEELLTKYEKTLRLEEH